MNALLAGISIGLGTFYLVHTLIDAHGWTTVNKLLRFAPQQLSTADDVIAHVSQRWPTLADWMGCPYCMTPWFAAAAVVLFKQDWLSWYVSLGVTAALVRHFERPV